MNKENTKEFSEKFPNIYRSITLKTDGTLPWDNSAHESEFGPVPARLFGFECGDGWKDLLFRLSEKIEAEILTFPEEMRKAFYVEQVKEKYGTLRFYMSGETDSMSTAIAIAEEESAVTCEVCGKPGVLRGHCWLYTACDEHTKEGDTNWSGKDEE